MTLPIQSKDRFAYVSDAVPPSVIERLQEAKELAVNSLLGKNRYGNVVGVGIGRKVVDGKVTDIRCLRIYVQSKIDRDYLSPAAEVPKSFLEIPTDIIEVGFLGRAGKLVPKTRDDENEKDTGPGSSVRLKTITPNVNQGAGGTLGAVVQDAARKRYILSCNHVLAVNGRVPQDGTSIVTPALSEHPRKIAVPSPFFIPLADDKSNLVDCALALAGDHINLNFRSGKLDTHNPTSEADRGQKVQKDGAVTGLTYGTIVDLNADLYVEYNFGRFLFSNQIVIWSEDDNFATDGDSGSVVVNTETNQAVALIFAGAGKFAVACPLTEVLSQLSDKVGSKLELALP